jgi:adenylate kinase family enzyme
VIHLDTHFWQPGWVETPDYEWASRVAELTSGDRWIMDGNFGGTMEIRFVAADTIILLDLPRRTCLQRIVWRRIRYHRKSRPDMAEGCHEQLDWQFMKWVWGYPRHRRPAILARLAELERAKRIITLKNPSEVRAFLERVRAAPPSASSAGLSGADRSG